MSFLAKPFPLSSRSTQTCATRTSLVRSANRMYAANDPSPHFAPRTHPFWRYARRASRGRKPSVALLAFISRSTASTSPASSLRMSKSVIASSACGGVRPLQVRFHRLRERLRGAFRKQGYNRVQGSQAFSLRACITDPEEPGGCLDGLSASGSLPVVASQIVFGRRSLRRIVLGLCFACQHGPAFGFRLSRASRQLAAYSLDLLGDVR